MPIALVDEPTRRARGSRIFSLYDQHDSLPSATVLFKDFRIATTQAVAEAAS